MIHGAGRGSSGTGGGWGGRLRAYLRALHDGPLGPYLVSQDRRLYLASVVLPLLLYAVYVGLVRSNGYLSEAKVVVERDPVLSAPIPDLGLFTPSGSTLTDALVIKEYIGSRALLEALDAELQLRQHYSASDWDVVSRLDDDASREDFLEFYRDRVSVRVDSDSLVIHLEVEAYAPEYAQRLAQAIVRHADRFVNDISQKLAREQMAFVQNELEGANARLRQASDQLIVLQKKNELLSPEIEAQTLGQIIAALQSELAARRAELLSLRSYLNENAPEVVALRQRVAGLEQQIERERGKQVGRDESGRGDLVLEYQGAQMAVQVATDAYGVALKTLETARLDASRKAKHLVQVSAPGLPDEALVPRRAYSIVSALVLLHLGYFVLVLVVATVRDHRD